MSQTLHRYFPRVSLLITHYNRSRSLERLLNSFKTLHCSFEQVIVSDDGSKPEHLHFIRELKHRFDFQLVTTEKNKGLANNLNKGQDVIKTRYTLYVQEDFEPTPAFPEAFQHALQLIEERPEIDIVRFYAYFKYPYLKPLKNGFSEMRFGWLKPGYKKFYYYSDHPHLRRSNFLQKFGRYTEGIKSDKAEYLMMMSFLQKKGRGIYYDDYKSLFNQKNSSDEPSTVQREYWRQTENRLISFVRNVYRHLKFNFDYFFKKAG